MAINRSPDPESKSSSSLHPTCRPALWLLQGVDVVIDDWIISQRGDNW